VYVVRVDLKKNLKFLSRQLILSLIEYHSLEHTFAFFNVEFKFMISD